MLFGLPWFAVVAIVAIGGGLLFAYKEKEMEMEEKRMGSARELNEMRQIIQNLKSRVENLEAIAAEDSRSTSQKEANPLGEIQIDDEVERQNNDNIERSGRAKTQ